MLQRLSGGRRLRASLLTARPVSIRRSLLGSVAVLIVLLGAAILATTFLGERHAVQTLSRALIAQTRDRTVERLHGFFDPVESGLLLLRAWIGSGIAKPDDPEVMNRVLVPLMRQYPQTSSVLIADGRGHEHILFRRGNAWRSRQTRRDQWGAETRWLEWTDSDPMPRVIWRTIDYDPRTRPWYQGAAEQRARRERLDEAGLVAWTAPYTFLTLRSPGMTASVSAEGCGGGDCVAAFDVLLDDVSEFTTNLRISEHGAVVVLTDDNRVIGLPPDPRFASPATRRDALLKTPPQIGAPALAEALRELAHRGTGAGPVRFKSGGQAWWGDMQPFDLASQRALAVAVVVPEADLLAGLGRVRLGIAVVTLVALGLALLGAALFARRFSRPVEALVRESDRISRGDLEPGVPVKSSLAEIRHLADAHEAMRRALGTLLKMERDLQLARQIQQSTLPEVMPALAGAEIDGWSAPAEATGGDAYDVIGLTGDHRVTTGVAERAVLMLADASGHGIGPALSVTQVRAMLRMAVREAIDLPGIVRRMNAQLSDDLREGHFITAWFGLLDTRDHSLLSLSCGQAPILHYVSAEARCALLGADAPPLGFDDALDLDGAASIRLGPGDVVVVLSDGIFEARNARHVEFGAERVAEVLRTTCQESAPKILRALRAALEDFAGDTPAADDRTALVVKRTL